MSVKNAGSRTVKDHSFTVSALTVKLRSFIERMEKLGDKEMEGKEVTQSTSPEA